ncbi:hypothetical protein [Flavobacterium sp.]|uniref:hypothetical protein n=1 Tax=Flavobacterium sp. TaxID=239 RepID=UPI0022BC21D1|nr:hypothetical protein [Flavobacterium sp.]MCZ8168612.1 hypothetical protein [Flavobacterium sp.]
MEKPYDLEERTYLFAKNCRIYIRKLPKTISTLEDGKQLVRSSGSLERITLKQMKNLAIKTFF